MRIVAIANQKGGVGKTTTAVNLAAGLARLGIPVLLADVDPQANATSTLGLAPEQIETATLYHLLTGGATLRDAILSTRIPNLYLIPANLDLAGAEIEIARLEDHSRQLRRVLQPLRDERWCPFLLLDCPPSLGVLMTNALAAADEVVVPIQAEYFALEGLTKILHVMEEIRASGANPDLALGGILLTMVDMRTSLCRQVVNDVRAHFSDHTFAVTIPRTIRLAEAPSFGRTAEEHDPEGFGALAYRQLAEEFLRRNNHAQMPSAEQGPNTLSS